jgi:peptidoglycan/LPS O-acetylase OafA/YrhL
VTYRPDIDGLRALSVLAVIAFHLNGFVPGGYVGVDVFFVISGFLIGGMVFHDIDAGAFSFANFYMRRIRRLAPALAVTLLGSYAACIVLLRPTETVDFARSALAALFSLANVYFYATSGYFGPRAIDLPLLHLWSLGIEEQFYIIFPLMAVVLARYSPRALGPVLVVLGLLSLVLSQWGLSRNPEASFYLLHSRAFELTIGVLLARVNVKLTPVVARWLSVSGAALLMAAMFFYSERTRFPGLAALVPCLGTALIIWSGQRATVVSRMMSAPPAVYIGKISYPLYLAHWPLIVFGKIAMPEVPELHFALFVVCGSFLAAAATYHLVEKPVRSGAFTLAKISFLGSASSLSVIGAVAALMAHGFEQRPWLRLGDSHFETPNLKELFLQGTCFLNPEQSASEFVVQACLPARPPGAILWGDSHAAHHFDGLKAELGAAGYTLGMFTASACPPIIGRPVDGRPFCKDINDFVLSLVNSHKPEIVILAAVWQASAMNELEKTLGLLVQNDISVVVLGNTPVFVENVPDYLARRPSADIKVRQYADAETDLRSLLQPGRIRNVRYVSLQGITCPTRRCALTDKFGRPYYFDQGHLTREGSRWIAAKIVSDILANRPRS